MKNMCFEALKDMCKDYTDKKKRKSLLNKRKRESDSIEPCETTLLIGLSVEPWLCTTKGVERSGRKLDMKIQRDKIRKTEGHQ